MKRRFLAVFVISPLFVACGGGNDTGTVERPEADKTASSGSSGTACAEGGNACPSGLECMALRGGNRACGPLAAPGVVLIQDATLGGRCVSPQSSDTHPGASIASVLVIGVDGNPNGYGRMLWQQAGFEVAAERGSPPDGSAFTGDTCTAAYNLGCDGQAIFEIVGGDGQVRKIREGETVVTHLRGQDTCGEEVADDVVAAICNDPEAAASGELASCTFKVRMVEARSDIHGPDRYAGLIHYFESN